MLSDAASSSISRQFLYIQSVLMLHPNTACQDSSFFCIANPYFPDSLFILSFLHLDVKKLIPTCDEWHSSSSVFLGHFGMCSSCILEAPYTNNCVGEEAKREVISFPSP